MLCCDTLLGLPTLHTGKQETELSFYGTCDDSLCVRAIKTSSILAMSHCVLNNQLDSKANQMMGSACAGSWWNGAI
jgi:hypothetical protein